MAKTTIFTRITSQAKLARIYAEDGALRTAARLLLDTAKELEEIASSRDALINEAIANQVGGGTN